MKRSVFNFSVVVALLFAVGFSYAQEGFQVKHVVIDAGHGGHDPGAVGKISKEKDIALSIALKVGNYITQNLKDVKVTYTRDKDVFVKLYRRAQMANEAKADLFISIHCNSSEKSTPKGTETFVMGAAKSETNLKVAQKENAAILLEADYDKTYKNFDPYSPDSYIKYNMILNEFRDQSIMFASFVQDQFTNRVHLKNRGVKEGALLVLVYTTMPSVLIETGFISNAEEEKFLNSQRGQDLLASAIYRAFKKYKFGIEGTKPTELSDELPKPVPTDPKVEVVNADTARQDVPEKKESPSSTEVIVGVQFTISTKKKSVSSFGEVDEVWYYEQGGMYKYVSGRFTDLASANAMLKKLKAEGYKDAFLVYFKNGERIKRSEAINVLK